MKELLKTGIVVLVALYAFEIIKGKLPGIKSDYDFDPDNLEEEI
jgi:hypothetical protein